MTKFAKGKCGVVGCVRDAPDDLVAMCRRHLEPHMRFAERVHLDPFRAPRAGEATEKKFNKVNWYWWRGKWRPSGEIDERRCDDS